VWKWLKHLFQRKPKHKKFVRVYGGGAGDTDFARAAARKLEGQLNGPLTFNPEHKKAIPSGPCFIFNVGPVPFSIAKGSAGTFYIPACPEGTRYVAGPVIPPIVMDSYSIGEELFVHETSGDFLAQDIVDPEYQGWSANTDLTKWGVFWTLNEVPTEAELVSAKAAVREQSRLKDLRTTKLLRNDLEKLGWKITPPNR
jgi:hypothetical protein